MNPDEALHMILQDEDVLIPVLFASVGVVAIIFGTLTGMVKSVARERTRREIAAYIAEGTMTPDQGERLMGAGAPKC
jgi:hypothetical protein